MLHSQLLLSSLDGVPSVLDIVVAPARQEAGNGGPLVPTLLLPLQQYGVFFGRPFCLLESRVKVVMPPFPALLSPPVPHVLGNHRRPILGTILGYGIAKFLIILIRPHGRAAIRFFVLGQIDPLLATLVCMHGWDKGQGDNGHGGKGGSAIVQLWETVHVGRRTGLQSRATVESKKAIGNICKKLFGRCQIRLTKTGII